MEHAVTGGQVKTICAQCPAHWLHSPWGQCAHTSSRLRLVFATQAGKYYPSSGIFWLVYVNFCLAIISWSLLLKSLCLYFVTLFSEASISLMLTFGTLVSVKFVPDATLCFLLNPFSWEENVTAWKHNGLFYSRLRAFLCSLLSCAMHMQLLFPTNLGGC